MTVDSKLAPTRRGLLVGGALGSGGLLVGCAVGMADVAAAPDAAPDAISLNAFVVILPNNKVQVVVGRAEMGQGIHSAMAQLVAEELEADWSDVEVVHAPADGVYGMTSMIVQALPFGDSDPQGTVAHLRRKLGRFVGRQLPLQMTGGSNSIKDGWRHMREVGAAARHMLLQAAAQKWSVPVDQCRASATQIIHGPTGRVLRFGDVAAKAARLSPSSNPFLKDPSAFTLVGKGVQRPDLPGKVDGTAEFGIDVRREGQLFATLRQSPVWGGKLKGFDDSAAQDVPGFVKAVPVTDGVAVVATNSWAAKQALELIEIDWDTQGNETRNTDGLRAAYQEQLGAAGNEEASIHKDEGDAAEIIAAAAKSVTADYEVP
ncbi:MAG: molybdopterin cofactor-binding domain-containing protein, partial [Alphaproteobacteria bacterium]